MSFELGLYSNFKEEMVSAIVWWIKSSCSSVK